MNLKIIVLPIFVLLSIIKVTYAYIDPGTGASIIGSFWPMIIAFFAFLGGLFVKIFIKPLKNIVLRTIKTIKTHKAASLVILFIPLSIIIFIILSNPQLEKMDQKLLIIGIDGADPRVIEKLISQDLLPNFKKLKNQGTFLPLQTSNPSQSPVAWTTLATGVNPGKHNLFDFISRNPNNYLPQLSLADTEEKLGNTKYKSFVKATPFWQITSKNGIPTTIIRWPLTFPVEEVKGNLLAGLGLPDIKGLLNSYSFYTSAFYDKTEEGAEKIIPVEIEDNKINTIIKGPRIKKSGKIIDIETPMLIKINNKDLIAININNKGYDVSKEDWSDWLRIEFKIGFFKKASGIAKVYLESTEPFKMYLTTVQVDPEDPIFDISYPKGYSKELAEEIGLYHTLGIPEDTNALNERKISDQVYLQQIAHIEKERDKMFWYEFEKFNKLDSGILAFVYDSSDRVQHIFWEEKVLENNNRELPIHSEIKKYYIEKDKLLGEILNKINDRTKLIIISDHGFSSFERSVNVNKWLYDNNYLVLKQQPTDKDPGELFKYVDWSKTKAYSLGFSSIYLNLKGREKQGIVEQSEKEKLEKEIISKLIILEDPKYNKKAIHKLYRTEEIYQGDYTTNGPDIVIGFNPGFRISWQNAIGGTTKEIFSDNTKKWKADHIIDPEFVPGIFFSNFKIEETNLDQKDLAPTVLSIFNITPSDKLEGKSLISK
ncbi:MAG: alkaline phosphatase family protein [Nanoarchaeota archaeon]|mgnify:CR=1 FL=1